MKPKKKARVLARGFACVGTHGKIYVCDSSPHEATIGRFEIYYTEADALRNAISPSNVVKVTVHEQGKKGEK